MSLQLAAQHLASKGRGPDTTLVHMAPREVAGLQALARAHGGTLTTNPDTGLPEAGFLSALLPMVAGAFLGPAGLGLTAMQAGLATGALGTLATGSLKKGLLAGLGAYGGAGLMGSVAGAGTGAISAGAPPISGSLAGLDAGMTAYPVTPAVADVGTGMYDVSGFKAAPQVLTPETEQLLARYPAPVTPTIPVPDITVTPPAPATTVSATDPYFIESAQQRGVEKALSTATPMDKIGAGFKAIADKPGLLLNSGNLMYGATAAAPLLFQEPKQAKYQGSGPNPYQYVYEPGRQAYVPITGSSEQMYFDPRYRRVASGGLAALAAGGPVEDMSMRNRAEMMMANGGQMYAAGGTTESGAQKYTYDPATQTYKPVVADLPPIVASQPNTAVSEGLTDPSSWSTLSPAQQAAFYSANPEFAAVTQAGQKGFGFTSLGMLQGLLSPDLVADQMAIAQGIDPGAGAQGASAGKDGAIGSGGTGVDGKDGPSSSGGSDNEAAGGLLRRRTGGISALAHGGQYNLGDYSDGGRLLRGPGDGVSDEIPATIADKRPARLADGEFVVPARIVSELGNGSTDAGARKLYAMMDRVQRARSNTVGKNKVAVNSRAEKLLPA